MRGESMGSFVKNLFIDRDGEWWPVVLVSLLLMIPLLAVGAIWGFVECGFRAGREASMNYVRDKCA